MNAKEELQKILDFTAKIKCAKLETEGIWDDPNTLYVLKLNYNEQDLIDFYNSLDFNYSNDYGEQKLFGIVWLEDGSWLTRGEYDGSEWWTQNTLPLIPKDCI